MVQAVKALFDGRRRMKGSSMEGESISLIARKLDVVYAANELCRKRRFDAIAVSDICDAAGISPSTFYRLFNGKHDVPAWYLRFATNSSIDHMGAYFSCEQAFCVMLGLMERCRFLYSNVKDTPEMDMIDRAENERISQRILENLCDYHDIEPDEELKYELSWVTVAGVALSGEWLHGRFEEAPDKLARIFAECYPQRLRALLDAPPAKDIETPANIGVVLALISKPQ